MSAQRGQSLAEFAAGSAAFALLLLGTITLAGFQEIQRRMAVAAREAAFATIWLNGRGDAVRAVREAGERHLTGEQSLGDATGRTDYLRPGAITTTAARQSAPGHADVAARLMLEPLQVVDGFASGSFDLASNAMLVGAMNVRVDPLAHLPRPFSQLSLNLQQPIALLSDAWNAADPQHVRRRAEGLIPSTALVGLQRIWRPLLAPLSLVEPALSELCLGLVEPDRVPEDRLSAGRTPLPSRCP